MVHSFDRRKGLLRAEEVLFRLEDMSYVVKCPLPGLQQRFLPSLRSTIAYFSVREDLFDPLYSADVSIDLIGEGKYQPWKQKNAMGPTRRLISL